MVADSNRYTFDEIYLDGKWMRPEGSDSITVFDSTDGSILGHVPEGTPADADAAVAAAARAAADWAGRPAAERAAFSEAIAEGLAERRDEIAALVSREAGTPERISRLIQAGLPHNSFTVAAEVARAYEFETMFGDTLVVREPTGVVACVTPWNYPLHQVSAKTAFALAAGCTVVLKPSEVSPLDAFVLAEIVDAAQLPSGVFNVVSGTGPVVGEALVTHSRVDMISFTGSTRVGMRIAALASASIKRLALELGGKSANTLLDDLDDDEFRRAVRRGVGSCFINSGQTCTALTRMLIPRSRLREAEGIVAEVVANDYQPGDPFAEGTRLGPLASAAQVERVNGYIRTGIEEGARLLCGGPKRVDELPAGGFYVRPTVFADVTNSMAIAQEEIFGPVLCMIGYDSEDDAIRIANDSHYGLSGGVWGSDTKRATSVARRIRTGRVEVNGAVLNPNAPFGGYKHSGYGLEYGVAGFEEFLQTKSIHT
jgi:acyl-CoA reductase-like NAD-dependent aldehyde dehydrogenase